MEMLQMITSVVMSDSNSVFARLWAVVTKDLKRHSAIHLTNEGLVWQLRRQVVVACVELRHVRRGKTARAPPDSNKK